MCVCTAMSEPTERLSLASTVPSLSHSRGIRVTHITLPPQSNTSTYRRFVLCGNLDEIQVRGAASTL